MSSQPTPLAQSAADAFICDTGRTPFGRYGGALSSVRADDLATIPVVAMLARNPGLKQDEIDDFIFGATNQAGEDNRDVARHILLLAGLPVSVTGTTVNRLCGSSMEAVIQANRSIRSGDAGLIVAGGVESMSRAPFVTAKAEEKFQRTTETYDTTIGWRFPNPRMKEKYGIDSMPETAENVAEDYQVSRADQDAFALRSQQRALAAQARGFFNKEIVPVTVRAGKGETVAVDRDEHPRETTLEKLAKLGTPFRKNGTVTAGNASGVNDGASVLFVASRAAAERHGLKPRARILGSAVAGVPPRIMGIGPIPATRKLLDRLGMKISDIDVIELNEAFASQALACLRDFGLPDDAAHVNPNGGAIALGHPTGASGGRLIMTAINQLEETGGRYALCTMCIGIGQGIAIMLERV